MGYQIPVFIKNLTEINFNKKNKKNLFIFYQITSIYFNNYQTFFLTPKTVYLGNMFNRSSWHTFLLSLKFFSVSYFHTDTIFNTENTKHSLLGNYKKLVIAISSHVKKKINKNKIQNQNNFQLKRDISIFGLQAQQLISAYFTKLSSKVN